MFGVANSEWSFHFEELPWSLCFTKCFTKFLNILSSWNLEVSRGSILPKIASGSMYFCCCLAIVINLSWSLAHLGTTSPACWVTILFEKYLLYFDFSSTVLYAISFSSSSITLNSMYLLNSFVGTFPSYFSLTSRSYSS